jgi:hypothetical protein
MMVSEPDVSVTLAGKVTVLKLPRIGPLTKTLPAPHWTVAEHTVPPSKVTPPVRDRVPMIVGLAVVGAVADNAAGSCKFTLPGVADGAMGPNRISAGWDKLMGGKIVALTGILLVSACAGAGKVAQAASANTPRLNFALKSFDAPMRTRACFMESSSLTPLSATG